MTAYIIIDRNSGYIFFDTRALPRDHVIAGEAMRDRELTPALACQWGDEAEVATYGRTYRSTHQYDIRATYDVYRRVDVGVSEAVQVVQDGQDRETIAAVERDCEYVTSIIAEEDDE